MQFLYQPLTWGFLLVGVPILVHLINMLRHRKRKWAAMDFLLESYRRNRRWVLLKQWLLLAARMLVMLLLVAMLAKWVSSAQFLGLLGGTTTHHYIVLDDSYSMAETEGAETAYNRALQALGGLVRSIASQSGQHQVTLLRLSRVNLAMRGSGDASIDAAADFLAQSVPRDPNRLLDRLNATEPSGLQLGYDDAIDLINPLIAQNAGENAEVYLLSDMRQNEFAEPETLRSKLQALHDGAAAIHVIDCGLGAPKNLTVVGIEPEQEVWAASVPLMVRIQIRNPSSQPANNIVVKVRAISYPQGAVQPQVDRSYSGEVLDLPPVVVERIEPGQTVTRQVQVIFGTAGQHVVEVTLPADGLPADNRRWCVIDIQQSQKILAVDGEPDRSNAYFLETLVNPDARLRTGMTLEQRDVSYLRDAAEESLNAFSAICLLDVPRLDPQAITKLEAFCRRGGGLFFTAGANTNLQFTNEQLYRSGNGIFPVELAEIRQNPVSADRESAQVTALEHPILAPLKQLSNSPFFMLSIRQQIIPTDSSMQTAGLEVIAEGPQGSPLLLDKPLGRGRVVALLTGFESQWSNWAQDPTFVVLALRTLGYLGSFQREATSQPVGSPLEMVVAGETVLPDAEILIPGGEAAMRIRLLRKTEIEDGDANVARLRLGINLADTERELINGLLRPGVFETWMVNSKGEYLLQNAAHNVAAAEGNLQRVTPQELQQKFPQIPLRIRSAEAVSASGLSSLETTHSAFLLGLLVLLLMLEQLLAYSASYHAPILAGRS